MSCQLACRESSRRATTTNEFWPKGTCSSVRTRPCVAAPVSAIPARRVTLCGGYRYKRSLNTQTPVNKNRPDAEFTNRWVLPADLLMSNRARGELRFVNSKFSWRHRDQLKLEKDFQVRRFQPLRNLETSTRSGSSSNCISRNSLIKRIDSRGKKRSRSDPDRPKPEAPHLISEWNYLKETLWQLKQTSAVSPTSW